MTFIICPSNNVFEMYLKSLELPTKEKHNYQRLTEPNQSQGFKDFSVLVIGNESHQYFSFIKTVKILEEVNNRKNMGLVKEIKTIKSF